MSEADFLEATSALSAASSRAARAASKPTRAGVGWAGAGAREDLARFVHQDAVGFVPPPSKPRTQRIGTRISDFTGEMENEGAKDNAESLRAPRFAEKNGRRATGYAYKELRPMTAT